MLFLYYAFFSFFFGTLKHACFFYLLQYFHVLDEGHQLYGDDKTIILPYLFSIAAYRFQNKAFNANAVTD